MTQKRITLIGAGNMARAIVLGMIQAGYPKDNITLSNPTREKLDYFKQLGVQTTTHNTEAAQHADVILLCVKPNKIETVCSEIRDCVANSTLIISIAASITTDFIAECLGGERAIVRVMPNTAVCMSAGVVGLYARDGVTEEQQEFVENLFSEVAAVIWLEDEAMMPVITSVFGSGIAYYYRFIELMSQEAVAMGLPQEAAEILTAQTALGAAKLTLESGETLANLRAAVTSKGGTTQAALDSFEKDDLESTIRDAIQAAYNRSKETTEELCKH